MTKSTKRKGNPEQSLSVNPAGIVASGTSRGIAQLQPVLLVLSTGLVVAAIVYLLR